MPDQDTPDTPKPEDEVKNPAAVLAKNKELLARNAELQARVGELEGQLQTAQGAETTWRDRWHQAAVLAPLEADLRTAAVGPWKYLRDTCTELGLLKMQSDDDGLERPAWFDEKGEPADLSNGLWRFLSDVYGRTGGELGNAIRGPGASGGGSGGNYHPRMTSPAPAPARTSLSAW